MAIRSVWCFVAAIARDGCARVVRHDFGERPKVEICDAALAVAIDLLHELLDASVR
jgi:hypothetical protein